MLSDVRRKNGASFKMGGLNFLVRNQVGKKGAGGVAIGCGAGSSVRIINPEAGEELLAEIAWRGEKTLVALMYNHPGKKCNKGFLREALEESRRDPNRPFFLGGDLNAPHTAFGSRFTNQAGEELLEWIVDEGLIYADNKTPTYYNYSRRGCNVLDMIFMNQCAEEDMERLEVMGDVGSDHMPLRIHRKDKRANRNPRNTISMLDKDKIRRAMEVYAEDKSNKWVPREYMTGNQLEKEIGDIMNHWRKCKEEATRLKDVRTRGGVVLSPGTVEKIKGMRRLGRQRRNINLTIEEAESIRRSHNRAKKEVRKAVEKEEQVGILIRLKNSAERRNPAKTWKEMNATMNRKQRDGLVYPIKDHEGTLKETEREIAEVHMERMKKTCSIANAPEMNDGFMAQVEQEVEKAETLTRTRDGARWGEWREEDRGGQMEYGDEDLNLEISRENFDERIGELKAKAAPGPDGITNGDIKNLGTKAREMWRRILEMALNMGLFPQEWKVATVVMIVKPNKPRDQSSSYRPVSLTSAMGKLYERFMGQWLDRIVMERNLQAERQCGFTKGRSTGEALLRLVEDVYVAYKGNGAVGLVLLDIEKAFDQLWPAGLVYKLISAGLPTKLIRIIANFMRDRMMEIKVGKTKTDRFRIEAGAPQGAINSPRLYKFFTRDIPVIPNMAENGAGFADDLSEWVAGYTIEQINKILQEALDKIQEWSNLWRLKIAPSKSQCLLFSRNRDLMKKELRVNMGGTPIPQEKSVKLLGVNLDGYLSWNVEIDSLKAKSEGAALQVRKLSKKIGKHEPDLVRQTFEALVMSPIHYSAPLWINMKETQWRKIEMTQERTIKWVMGYPKHMNGRLAVSDSGIRKLRDVIEERASSRIKKILANAPFGRSYLTRWNGYKHETRHESLLQGYAKLPRNKIYTLFDCGFCNFGIPHYPCTGMLQLQLGPDRPMEEVVEEGRGER